MKLSMVQIIGIVTLIALVLLVLTGCNKQVIDLDYTYDRAICKVGSEYITIDIDKWNDYDGEQIQIKAKDGYTYLVSSINCTLIRD